MGSDNLHELLAFPEEESAYQLENISAMQVSRQLSAMRIGYDGAADNSQLVYLEEVPISTFIIPCAIKDKSETSHRWLRLEVLFEGNNKSVQSKHQLMIAEHPYYIKRVHYATLMRGSKHGRPEATESFASLDEAIKWAHSFSHDYFYTGKGLIAALSQTA